MQNEACDNLLLTLHLPYLFKNGSKAFSHDDIINENGGVTA